jgi:hypothetical protein
VGLLSCVKVETYYITTYVHTSFLIVDKACYLDFYPIEDPRADYLSDVTLPATDNGLVFEQ